MPRWITVRRSFDYTWPSRAVTAFTDRDLGDHFVKDELADFAVEKGHATEGKVDDASRSTKGKKGRRTAKAADLGSDDAVDQPDMADADRTADRGSVDRDSGER